MQLKLILCTVILFIFNTSFISGDNGELILGVWLHEKYAKDQRELVKYSKFKKDKAGFAFKRFGRLISRHNTSWCGTEPIVYKNYRGSWRMTSDTTLKMRYHYYGGVKEEVWHIQHLKGSHLKVRILSEKVVKKKSSNNF